MLKLRFDRYITYTPLLAIYPCKRPSNLSGTHVMWPCLDSTVTFLSSISFGTDRTCDTAFSLHSFRTSRSLRPSLPRTSLFPLIPSRPSRPGAPVDPGSPFTPGIPLLPGCPSLQQRVDNGESSVEAFFVFRHFLLRSFSLAFFLPTIFFF